MISFEEFKKIFRGTGFNERELQRFFCSIKKSVILGHLGKRVWPDLIKLEAQYQWPILQKIADPKLSIYRGADKELLERFINTIDEEKGVRGRGRRLGKISHWTQLQSILRDRTELFTHIFGFSEEDTRYCEKGCSTVFAYIGKKDEKPEKDVENRHRRRSSYARRSSSALVHVEEKEIIRIRSAGYGHHHPALLGFSVCSEISPTVHFT